MSESSSLSSKILVSTACLAIIVLLLGPFAYKFGILPLQPALLSLIVALGLAVVSLLASIVFVGIAIKNKQTANRNRVSIAMIICLVPIFFVGAQLKIATSVPEIHDISTDTVNPPVFNKIVALREGVMNDLVYEHKGSAENLAELQKQAYPNVKTILSSLSKEQALEKSATVLMGMGLEIVSKDSAAGIVEATATTFWFGFKDDVVVRISDHAEGSSLDLRSVSRVGRSDVGVNAARILKFSEAF